MSLPSWSFSCELGRRRTDNGSRRQWALPSAIAWSDDERPADEAGKRDGGE